MDVSDAPEYLPDLVLIKIFSNLKLSDLFSCMLVCRNWNQAINNNSGKPWELMCLRKMPKEFLKSELFSQLPNHKDKLRALYHSWNENDCSVHIDIQNNGFTFERKPIAQSTDMVRTKIGYDTGKHVWELTWTGPLGTVAMVGVSTKEATLHIGLYVPLLGSNQHGWGWNLVDNVLFHRCMPCGDYPLLNNTKYQHGEQLRLVLDCENGTLHFEKDNVFLGIAFENLPKTKLYPTVSLVYGNTGVSVVYIGTL